MRPDDHHYHQHWYNEYHLPDHVPPPPDIYDEWDTEKEDDNGRGVFIFQCIGVFIAAALIGYGFYLVLTGTGH